MMQKILTAQIKEEIYNLPQVNQTHRELLYIDQRILNESKTRRKNLAMTGIDYKKHMICPAKRDNKLPQNVQDIR